MAVRYDAMCSSISVSSIGFFCDVHVSHVFHNHVCICISICISICVRI